MNRWLDPAGAVFRFCLGITIAVAVFFGMWEITPWPVAVVVALGALYLYGAASTNGWLPFTKRWKARRSS